MGVAYPFATGAYETTRAAAGGARAAAMATTIAWHAHPLSPAAARGHRRTGLQTYS